jgi:hypothetical protein
MVKGARSAETSKYRGTAVSIVTALGFGLPVVAYFWLIHRYALNVPYGDQWGDISLIGHSYNGTLSFGTLWALHNENRVFFPNLIVLALSRTTHFNIVIEEYFSGAMLIAATALIIYAHKRRSRRAWVYYCPVAILLLSFVQHENTLSGQEMASYLLLLSLAVMVVLLDSFTLAWIGLIGALVAATVGSFSSLQGLLIWPAGLVLLYHRRRPRPFFIVWVGCMAISVFLYFYGYQTSSGSAPTPTYALAHPITAFKFYLFAIGDVLGTNVNLGGHGNSGVLVFGMLVLVLAAAVVVFYGIKRDEYGGNPVGVALICFGLLFAATITDGRIRFYQLSGYPWAASASRYTTFDLLVLVGTYLALLGRPTLHVRMENLGLLIARVTVVVAVCVQVSIGIGTGLIGARSDYAVRVQDARVLANIDKASPTLIMDLGPISVDSLESTGTLRSLAHLAAQYHLSLFDGARARYIKEGLP